jgi:hypothetical protein
MSCPRCFWRRVPQASRWRNGSLLLAPALLLLLVAGADAADRAVTPADIELRRQSIAAQLAALADELATVTAALDRFPADQPESETGSPPTDADRVSLAAKRQALDTAAAALGAEQARLAAIRTRTMTGPLQRNDAQGIGSFDLAGTTGDQVTAGRAFNPAISIIPDANYYMDNRRGRASTLIRQADGFAVAEDEDPATTDPERGFNLREVEAAFAGTIDPYFDVWATVVLQRDSIQAEEAYVQTRRFIPGLQLRFGKFLSGIGYINRQHPHQWDFFDQALPYEAILGGGIADTGVQATWLPPLPVYLLLGFEALQGDTPRLASYVERDRPDLFEERAGPRLLTGFLRVSPDIGFSNAVQLGVSYARSRAHQEVIDAGDLVDDGREGPAWLAGADIVWRHESGRAYGHRNATLQAEYLFRRMTLDRVTAMQGADAIPTRESTQDGLYAQLIYGVVPRWTVGGRFDVIGLRNRIADAVPADFDATIRYTVNATFDPTEFSRIRTQYSHARVRSGGLAVPAHQFSVQVQMSLGAHGAHRF